MSGLGFGQRVRITADNEYADAICQVMDCFARDGRDMVIVKLPDGQTMVAPVADCEPAPQEEFIYSGQGKRRATPEEVQRVRLTECSRQGHSFTTILRYGSIDPQAVICSNCGDSWRVVPNSEDPA